MPLPLFFILSPLVGAAVALLLRPLTRLAALLAALWTALLAWAVVAWPAAGLARLLGVSIVLDRAWIIGGQSLALDATMRPPLAFLYAVACVCFLGGAVVVQNRSFATLGLLLVAVFSASILVRPLYIAPITVAIAAVVAAFYVQMGNVAIARGVLRHIAFSILAFPLFLIANWYLQQGTLDPSNVAAPRTAAHLITWGFFLLLGAAPAHGALRPLFTEMSAFPSAFLVLAQNVVVLALLVQFLAAYPDLAQYVDISPWLGRLGLLTTLWGGIGALSQRNYGRLVAYAALHNYGVVLLGMSLLGPLGIATTMALLSERAVCLLLAAVGLAVLQERLGETGFGAVRGIVRRAPWALFALLAGTLGLAGAPLTAGFPSRWMLLRLVEEQAPPLVWIPVIAGVLVALGVVRSGAAALGLLPPERLTTDPVEREGRAPVLFIGLLVVVSVALALAPQILAPALDAALEALTGIAP